LARPHGTPTWHTHLAHPRGTPTWRLQNPPNKFTLKFTRLALETMLDFKKLKLGDQCYNLPKFYHIFVCQGV
jgi:hypothetical protein